jgi:hypothetical protein
MQLFIAQRQEMIVDSPKSLDPEESWGHHFNSNKSCAVRSCSRIWSIESASAFIVRNQHVQYIFRNHGVDLPQNLQEPTEPIHFSTVISLRHPQLKDMTDPAP